MIIADFDYHLERQLQQMLADVRKQGARASEPVAWAHLNMTVLRQQNAAELRRQWTKNGRKANKLELNDIPKLIQKAKKFDNTNEDFSVQFRSNGPDAD